MTTLMDAAEVHRRLAAGERTVLLDVRWVLGRADGHDEYLAGHLPGAVYVDLPTELADPAQPGLGRHPLPSQERFQASARRWGINDGDTVVAYDNSDSMAAARAWWMLRDAGMESVYLLDGGLAAWRAAGFRVETGDEHVVPGSVNLAEAGMPVITEEQASRWHSKGVLLDARAGERYRGEVEPIDPKAGHIPGAVSAPTTLNLDADGRFLPAPALRTAFADLGIDGSCDVAVYCGSGVTAAHQIAALEIAGFQAALFPGSFSQWSNHAANPVVVGSRPFGAPGVVDEVPLSSGSTGTGASTGSSVEA
ncbi:sulfurtransferase [Arthrobacter sp. fls2-241-R2A-200]|uniref:sulfurtransferase n=1 Tax=Arthrobacter sp. fls2-241-R2A-200 TaxID=3040281 RepID=UPI00254CC500|nr:sulfurtransferase [Arthrobacter sp. fls2-241-R2A-200]